MDVTWRRYVSTRTRVAAALDRGMPAVFDKDFVLPDDKDVAPPVPAIAAAPAGGTGPATFPHRPGQG